MTYNVFGGTLNLKLQLPGTKAIKQVCCHCCICHKQQNHDCNVNMPCMPSMNDKTQNYNTVQQDSVCSRMISGEILTALHCVMMKILH